MALPSLTVEIAFATDPFTSSPTYVDVTSRVRADTPIIIKRGRQNELGRIEAGRASFALDNRDRALDPLNTASPYYPNVIARRRCRIRATYNSITYDLFVGFCRFANNWGVDDNICQVVALDALDMFARIPYAVEEVAYWDMNPTGLVTVYDTNTYTFRAPGQVRVVLDSVPDSGQSIQLRVRGDGWSGVSHDEVFNITSSNWTNVLTSSTYRNVTELQSTTDLFSGYFHRAMTLYWVPAQDQGFAGTHIQEILEYARWPLNMADLDGGSFTLSPWTPISNAVTFNDFGSWTSRETLSGAGTVLTALQRVAEIDNGLLYVNGSGWIVFRMRDHRVYSLAGDPVYFGSGTGEIAYRDPTFDDGDAYVFNHITLQSISDQVYSFIADSAEVAVYGPRQMSMTMAFVFSSSFHVVGGHLLSHRKNAVPRVTGITVDADTTNYATLLPLEISDIVTPRLRPPRSTAPIDRPSFVESTEWRITRSSWQVKIGLSPAELDSDLYNFISGADMAFPVTPYVNQVFYRTDLKLLCVYDGTRWLTVHEEIATLTPFSGYTADASVAPTVTLVGAVRSAGADNLYITTISVSGFVLTTNNGSNYWSFSVQNNGTNIWSSNTSAFTASSIGWLRTTVNAVYAVQIFRFRIDSKTGSPGTFNMQCSVAYRRVIT